MGINAADNAISAIFKMMSKHGAHLEMQHAIPMWISTLPVRRDRVEAQLCHSYLMSLCSNAGTQNVAFGPNNTNIPKLVKIFGQIRNTDLSTARVNRFIGAFVAQLPP